MSETAWLRLFGSLNTEYVGVHPAALVCTLLKVAGESEYVVENRARWGGSLVCKRHRYQVNDKLMPRSREFIAVSKLERIYLHTAKCPAWACMRTVSGEQGTV
jgi:hypothetical protein